MARNNRLLYAIAGCVTGPIGGAIAGYQYAKNQQRIYELNPTAKREWDSVGGNVLVGILFGPVAGALFGWGCGGQEQLIDRLEAKRDATKVTHSQASVQINSTDMSQAQGQNQWRDRVAAETLLSAEQQR